MLKTGSKNCIRARLYVICAVSVIGLYFSVFANSKIALIVFAINALSLFLLHDVEAFSLVFFLMPFAVIYKTAPAASSLFTFLTILIAFVMLLKHRRISAQLIILVLVFATFLLLGIKNDFSAIIKQIANVLFGYAFVQRIKKEDFSHVVTAVSCGAAGSCFIGLKRSTEPVLLEYLQYRVVEVVGDDRVERFAGLYTDPNYFGLLIICCIFTMIVFMLKKEIPLGKGIIIVGTLIGFGCVTYSRLFYITLLLVFVLVIAIICRRSKQKTAPLIAIGIFAVVGLYVAGKSGIIQNVLARFTVEDISNNRFNLFERYLKYIWENQRVLLFGVGIEGEILGAGTHNLYIEAVYYFGIVGSCLYLALYATVLSSVRLITKRTVYNYSLLIVILIGYVTLQAVFAHDMIFLLLMAWMIMNTDFFLFDKANNQTLRVKEAD